MVSEEVQRMITLEAPPDVWKYGAHADFRRTTAGKIENIGPSQPYRHPVTGEVRNQHYKYANVTGTPFDMYLNIIPGMHPFQWDLTSAVITASSFFLGLVDGVIDDKYVKDEVRILRKKIATEATELLETADKIRSYIQ